MSQAQQPDADDDDADSVHRPVAQNPKRGCGHLKHGKGYIRSAPNALDLPTFVEIEPRLPFKEGHYRGFRHFPGIKFEMSVMDRVDYSPRSVVKQDFGRMYGIADGDHIGEMDVAQAQDLIMWVGKTYYQPDEFIEEVRNLGLSKAIPLSKNQAPPTIVPGWTRVWCLHMNAIDGDRPGLLGYAPVGEVVYTEDADGQVPAWAQDYEATGDLVVAKVGDEVSAEATQNHALNDYEGVTLPGDDTPTESRNKRLDDLADTISDDTDEFDVGDDEDVEVTPERVVPSDDPNRDVEAVPVEEDGEDDDGA
jgi:hypothetical protein